MGEILRKSNNLVVILLLICTLWCSSVYSRSPSVKNVRGIKIRSKPSMRVVGLCPDHPGVKRLLQNINKTLDEDYYYISDGISIKKDAGVTVQKITSRPSNETSTGVSMCEYVARRITDYAKDHYLDVNLAKVVPTARSLLNKSTPRFGFGKNSFLTGFGLGFLAFGLKKLLLPVFIGAQIIKSILIAMFLPSIIGSIGKLVGKGVTTFAQSSGHSNYGGTGGIGADSTADFEFKDTTNQQQQNYDPEVAGSDSTYSTMWTYPSGVGGGNAIGNNWYNEPSNAVNYNSQGMTQYNYQNAFTDYGNSNNNNMKKATRYSQKSKDDNNKHYSGSFYTKDKAEDFKVFHTIPSSSHLLANYDPFYSPLLSRMDSVFKQLGYNTEPCRERLVCNMYKNPAKYAPFSNLVSAQLSRELNELRKPSSDNPEILRFFRYMKAAKDGQDGQECEVLYSECVSTKGQGESAPMVTTFNDINKLVQARSIPP